MPENKVQITLEAVNKTKEAVDQAKSGVQGLVSGLKANWLQITAAGAAIYGVIKTFDAFISAASEAEQIESRMAFQVGQAGYKFQEIKPFVDDFADSILKTTRFSDEMARQGLGQMMQYTADVTQAMQGVRLAMDMSTQSGQDLGSTVRYVGMAMNGNAEILGRWIPELRDLETKLGKDATNAEKAAYAIKILNEKFGGAAQTDLKTYAGQVANLKNQYDELKESIGRVIMKTGAPQGVIGGAKSIFETIDYLQSGGLEGLWKNWNAQIEATRKASEQAQIATAAKAYADDLADWKAKQDERQALNYQFAIQEWTLKKNMMAVIDGQEFMALEKAKKIGADLNQIRTVYHKIRIDQIKKEKEEEFAAMSSLATLWQAYYNNRISKENEIIALIKGQGIETTVGAKFEFAGVEEEFRRISEKASLFTQDEFEKMKAIYVEKLKDILPAAGGEWEEISIPTGREISGIHARTTYETDYRWREAAMTEEQRRIEQMREESMRRIEAMSKGAEFGKPSEILTAFDQTRAKALELEQTLLKISDQKLQIDSSKLIDAIGKIDETKGKLIDLINGDYKIRVGVEIVGEELIQNIENKLADRWRDGRSGLKSPIEGE